MLNRSGDDFPVEAVSESVSSEGVSSTGGMPVSAAGEGSPAVRLFPGNSSETAKAANTTKSTAVKIYSRFRTGS